MKSSFISENKINKIGFKNIGTNCFISQFARFYNPSDIEIGNNVRIDDFSILSGKIKLGSYIHISAYSILYGSNGIELEDYSGISARCSIYSAIDDFSGDFLIGPMVPAVLTNIIGGKIIIKKYVQIGANTVVFPKLIIEEGAIIGALSLVNKSLKPWSIYAGIPVKLIKERSKKLLQLI